MEFKQLQYFLSAAEYLNFTEAAQACFIVQSAMSQQISSLEKELGVTLFVREKRVLRLTAEGETLVLEARKILNQVNHSRLLVQSIAKGYQHVFRIGCNGDLCRENLPRALERFRETYPYVKALVMHGQHTELITQMENGQIDCMISLFWPEYNLKNWNELPYLEGGSCACHAARQSSSCESKSSVERGFGERTADLAQWK